MTEVDDILRLAAIIRRVDGNHDKGAAALAEAILSHPDSRWQHAQPEPQGPTNEELEDFALQNGGGYFNCDCQEEADILTRKHISNYRAVLTRWGRPAIGPVPVSERLPGPEDCDAEGQCWWWDEDDDMWRLSEHRPWLLCWTHWLPRGALPVPAPANTINQNNY
jgi:hypothetical protein